MATESLITELACRKCGERKLHTLDYFQDYVTERGKIMLRKTCRVCRGSRPDGRRPYRKGLSDQQRRENNRQQCRDNYYRNREVRLDAMASYRTENRGRLLEYDRERYLRERAAGTDFQKQKYARTDKEKARADLKRWKSENPDKVRAMWERTYEKHRHKHKARQDRWRKKFPEAVAAARDRRRAREFGAEGTYTKDDVRALLKRFGRTCFYCGDGMTKFHVDHFIPLSRGGSNCPENLRLSCPPCNWSKGGKMPWEWMPDRFRCDETG